MKQQTIVLADWQALPMEQELRAAFRRKSSWVIHSPRSSAVWHAAVLGNLTRDYTAEKPMTIDVVQRKLSAGLDRSAFEQFKQLAEITNEQLGRVIRVTMRTLARRKTFRPDESERLFRVTAVFQKTLELFDDLNKARRWFATPKRALGEKTPLEYCATELGAEEVKHLLGRMEHGVFS